MNFSRNKRFALALVNVVTGGVLVNLNHPVCTMVGAACLFMSGMLYSTCIFDDEGI